MDTNKFNEIVTERLEKVKATLTAKVKKQPPDLTAGEFNRREC